MLLKDTSNLLKKRLRGAILTSHGYERLVEAMQVYEIKHNFGHGLSWRELSAITGLSRNTLFKISAQQKTVDISSLEIHFEAFGLQLSSQDYYQPGKKELARLSGVKYPELFDLDQAIGLNLEEVEYLSVLEEIEDSLDSLELTAAAEEGHDAFSPAGSGESAVIDEQDELNWAAIQASNRPVYITQFADQQNLFLNFTAVMAQSNKPPGDFLRSTAHTLNFEDELLQRCRYLKTDHRLIEYEYQALRWFQDPDTGLWIRRRMQFVSNFYRIFYLGRECWLGEVLVANAIGGGM